jgi:hypothetical protein
MGIIAMPVQLNVGLSRKIGQPNFGSRGASLNLEVELDASAIDAPDRLRERIKQLYGLMKVSIDEELGATEPGCNCGRTPCGRGTACRGIHNVSSPGGTGCAIRYATPGQVRAMRAIARRKQIDLPRLLQERFGTDRADELTVQDASVLIDDLDARPVAAAL